MHALSEKPCNNSETVLEYYPYEKDRWDTL